MKKEYDFSKSIKNPYAKHLKKQVTLRLGVDVRNLHVQHIALGTCMQGGGDVVGQAGVAARTISLKGVACRWFVTHFASPTKARVMFAMCRVGMTSANDLSWHVSNPLSNLEATHIGKMESSSK